jgi:chromatin remodeling complex protein RSC6
MVPKLTRRPYSEPSITGLENDSNVCKKEKRQQSKKKSEKEKIRERERSRKGERSRQGEKQRWGEKQTRRERSSERERIVEKRESSITNPSGMMGAKGGLNLSSVDHFPQGMKTRLSGRLRRQVSWSLLLALLHPTTVAISLLNTNAVCVGVCVCVCVCVCVWASGWVVS